MWDLESIFNAKAIDTEDVDKTIFRLDPMNEVQVEVGAVLKSIVRSKRQLEDHNDWFLQVSKKSIYIPYNFLRQLRSSCSFILCTVSIEYFLGCCWKYLESGSFIFTVHEKAFSCISMPCRYEIDMKIVINSMILFLLN